MKRNLNTVMLAGLVILMTACSTHPTEPEVTAPSHKNPVAETISIETQQVAAEQKAKFVTELTFRKKDSNLSRANVNKIQKLIDEAAKNGKIEEVKVISWADAEFPSVHTKKLSSEQRNIAKERNRSIEAYIEGKNENVKVKTYSMAERANALKDFIGSSEARIKNSLEVAGIPTTDTTVKFPSKASKAIVMILMK